MRAIRLATAAVILLTGFVVSCDDPAGPDTEALLALGNANFNGPHYNLNIIGVPKGKTASMDDNNGHRIFVLLDGKTKIMLAEGSFAVDDANGTDGQASFFLPNPDDNNDGITAYSVFARALGKPGGSALLYTCATESGTDDEYCATYAAVEIERSKGNPGKPKSNNVSKELLYVYADLDGNETLERYPLFDDALQDYYWSYDNYGLKLVQLRFYELEETDVNE